MPKRRTVFNSKYMLRVLAKDELLWSERMTLLGGDFGLTDLDPEDHTNDFESWSKPCTVYCVKCNASFRTIPKEILGENRCPFCKAPLYPKDDDEFLDWFGLRLYRERITRLTQVAARHFRHLVGNFENLQKYNGMAEPGFVRDHIFCVQEGFERDIPAEVIASPVNIQIITDHENYRKGRRFGMTLEQLETRYQRLLAENPKWLELVRLSDESEPGTIKVRIE